MSHAEKCPVCQGAGKITLPKPDYSGTAVDLPLPVTCHGCGGAGWIVVP